MILVSKACPCTLRIHLLVTNSLTLLLGY